ncbi:glycosyltransferase family 2 protein [Corallococcus sp. RDP092CA]|uniref:glycosyltransferase family 2 protein n=1 Tax=Corallococcus sp. RDP092CA TaxID=3109369 RepID=UPI0035B16AD5
MIDGPGGERLCSQSMPARPVLSIVIPWKDRPELGVTLKRNRRFFTAHPYEVVVVNCGGSPALFREGLHAARFPGLRGVELPGTPFNKSLALNVGASDARADCLFFLDTDVVLKSDFLEAARERLGRKHFVTVDRVFESEPARERRESKLRELAYAVHFVDEQGREARVETNRVHLGDGSRSGPGMVLMRRKHFEAVNGMNSDLAGWGWEDLDLLVRLQLELGLTQRRHGDVLHLTHGDDRRDLAGQTRAQSEHLNLARCMESYHQGHYWGTRVDDATTWKARQVAVAPAPVRGSAGRRTAGP